MYRRAYKYVHMYIHTYVVTGAVLRQKRKMGVIYLDKLRYRYIIVYVFLRDPTAPLCPFYAVCIPGLQRTLPTVARVEMV